MNVLVLGGGPFPRPSWFEALRRWHANTGVFVVDRGEDGIEILRGGVDVTAVVIGLPLAPDDLISEAERLCGATIDSGHPLPWIIALRDGSDDDEGLLALRRRGVNVTTSQEDTLRILEAVRASDLPASEPVAEKTAPPTVEPAREPDPSAPRSSATSAPADPTGEGGSRLTPRQTEVLALVNEGKSNKEIARVLDLAEGTVKVHCKAIFRALGVANRTQAAVLIAKAGLCPRVELSE